ncbi:tripartite tricarboxylate transporter substrate binding protein [Pusillimonas sp. ANT_WB101]|uniref:Bug family tripartite tricarboxylate transporter substrate binding protein n=1 Tax=Pusillimonas sp. ANT_WB101 TaxID=2597356 RepID=UPI0011EFA080|nr:tripartite tricarboxylate transporter substrate binding protein [Pusillimonas sp. ANT_WB101]KAA0889444.1 tripartite tricarboxylate transporter substrate binding protein [Pusillimonas sp. ANT_WB101]
MASTLTKSLRLLTTAAIALMISTPALAGFPDRPVKLVVPYTPGGSADMLSRLMAEHMSKTLGQPVIVENKPGASTRIAANMVARSAPDGYTLFLASNSSMVLNPMLYSTIEYDPVKDFEVIGIVLEMPLVVVTSKDVPANTLPEFIEYAKANPGKLNYASVGLGNPLQLATQMLVSATELDIVHVPYNGSAPALSSLVANDTQLMVDGIITSLPFIKEGRLKALAVASEKRLPVLPDTMTVAESAVPGFQAATWFGVATPAAVSDENKAILHEAISKAIVDENIRQRMEAGGMVMQPVRDKKEIEAYVSKDRQMWKKVIEQNQIKLD